MSVKSEIEREHARNQLDQQRLRLHQLAEDSGLFPAIREAAGELEWDEESISEDYEYSDKYPYNPTVLKISIAKEGAGYAEFRVQPNGNIWSHLDDQIFPIIKLAWKMSPNVVENLVARAFLNPAARLSGHIDQSGQF